MSKKLIFIWFMVFIQFYHFGSCLDANATDASLVSFSSGALLVEKSPGYDSGWDNIWIMDENPKTGWCCPKGKILDNVSVIELAEKSTFERVEFDTGSIDSTGRGAKDIVIELSDDGPSEGFAKILSTSLVDKKDNQSFPITVATSGKWLRLTIKNNHGANDYTELMDFRAFGKQLTKTQLPDVSGTYKTNYHDFHLRQQGTSVTGCYEYKQGLLNGGIENNIMRLTWKETKAQGPAVMIFNSKGDNFFGLWWYEGKENERGSIWNGQKKSQDVGGCPHWAGGVQGQMTKELLETGRVRLYGINFDVDSDIIRDESKPTLDKIVAMLQSEKAMQLIIEGHTDSDGQPQHNQMLSEKRAESVKAYLVSAAISSSRLFTKGFGASKPIAPNTTATGKFQNRRVELVKMTAGQKQAAVVNPMGKSQSPTLQNTPAPVAMQDSFEGKWEMAPNKRVKGGTITFYSNGTYLMEERLQDGDGVSRKGEFKVNKQASPARMDICLEKCGAPGSEYTTSFSIFRFLDGGKLEIRSSPDGKYPVHFNDGTVDEYTMILTRIE